MTHQELDLTADVIDIRDIIARVEEIESELESQDDPVAGMCIDPDLIVERQMLTDILEDLKGYGGDEQWRGDWYPVTLIREDHFTDYVQELLEDCGTIPRDLPHWVHIDWESTAREVKVDYSETTIDGTTYFYR